MNYAESESCKLIKRLTPMRPDRQILYLCENKQAYDVPISIILAQYKWCLLNGDIVNARRFEVTLNEVVGKQTLAEIGGILC